MSQLFLLLIILLACFASLVAQKSQGKTNPSDFNGVWEFVSEKEESPFRGRPPFRVNGGTLCISVDGDVVKILRRTKFTSGDNTEWKSTFFLDGRGEKERIDLPNGHGFTEEWKTNWKGNKIVRTMSRKESWGWSDSRIEYRLDKIKDQLIFESEQKLGISKETSLRRVWYRRMSRDGETSTCER